MAEPKRGETRRGSNVTRIIRLYRATAPLIHVWWRFSRGMTLGVRVAALDEAGRVALIRHTYKHGWELPGGGVERGETAEAAARRELEEEANAAVEGPFELVSVHANFAVLRGDHVLFYRCRARSLGARPADREIAEVRWVGPDDAPDELTAGARRRLEELWRGANASAHW
ncbi:MAG: NUDIX domain-containing protein [Maricaulaceae bacterium]|jgi:8-oxo-dGTP pyrophosphatase MutT (NUDIX family)